LKMIAKHSFYSSGKVWNIMQAEPHSWHPLKLRLHAAINRVRFAFWRMSLSEHA
jgi:hypothetical protein